MGKNPEGRRTYDRHRHRYDDFKIPFMKMMWEKVNWSETDLNLIYVCENDNETLGFPDAEYLLIAQNNANSEGRYCSLIQQQSAVLNIHTHKNTQLQLVFAWFKSFRPAFPISTSKRFITTWTLLTRICECIASQHPVLLRHLTARTES